MNGFKHTKGPWKAGEGYVECPECFLDMGSTRITCQNCDEELDFGTHICEVYGVGYIIDANARLIAAAPEMLDALIHAYKLIKSMVDCLGMKEPTSELVICVTQWRRVIERATGMTIDEAIKEREGK